VPHDLESKRLVEEIWCTGAPLTLPGAIASTVAGVHHRYGCPGFPKGHPGPPISSHAATPRANISIDTIAATQISRGKTFRARSRCVIAIGAVALRVPLVDPWLG